MISRFHQNNFQELLDDKRKENQQQKKFSLSKQEQNLIKQLNMKYLNDEPETQNCNIFLIRHAQSIYNFEIEKFIIENQLKLLSPETKFFRYSEYFLDSRLTNIGICQAIDHQKQINKISFDIVLVSPLTRTLETTYYLFMNHPQKNQIKFIIFPLLAEIFSMSNCIRDLSEVKQIGDQITFDFSEIGILRGNLFWQIDMLQNQTLRQKLNTSLRKYKQKEQIQSEILKIMENMFPKQLETWEFLWQRTRIIRKLIKQKYMNKDDPNQKIGIVSHQAVLTCIKSQQWNGWVYDGIKLNNCEIHGINIDINS